MIASTFQIDLRDIPEIGDFVRWTTASIDLMDDQGNEYIAAGGLLKIGAVTTENSIKSAPLMVTMGGLDPSIQDNLGNLDHKRPKVVIKRVTFNPETHDNRILTESVYFRGRGTSPEVKIVQTDNNWSVTLDMECYSSFDMDKKMELMRCNQQTHAFYHEGDNFFKYANQDMNEDLLWKAK